MTVQEFLTAYDEDHQNTITVGQKIRWLKQLELTIMSDIMHQHEDYDRAGIVNDIILHSGSVVDNERIINGTMDISDDPEMYVDGDTLTLTSYDPIIGRREADDFDTNTFLQVPFPYDNVYEYYLDQRIAHVTGNTKDYNHSTQLFNEAYLSFRKYYNRTHRSNHVRNHLLRHEVL